MTKAELSAIDQLRDEVEAQRKELHDYHIDVKTLVARCEFCRDAVEKLTTDMYGLPGNVETNSSLVSVVKDLCHSRRMMVYAMRGAWALMVALAAAIAAAFVKARQ